jgi:hypothetical protein
VVACDLIFYPTTSTNNSTKHSIFLFNQFLKENYKINKTIMHPILVVENICCGGMCNKQQEHESRNHVVQENETIRLHENHWYNVRVVFCSPDYDTPFKDQLVECEIFLTSGDLLTQCSNIATVQKFFKQEHYFVSHPVQVFVRPVSLCTIDMMDLWDTDFCVYDARFIIHCPFYSTFNQIGTIEIVPVDSFWGFNHNHNTIPTKPQEQTLSSSDLEFLENCICIDGVPYISP